MLALAISARVILDRLHERLQRGAQGRASLGVEQAIEPDQAILWLADVQVAPQVGVIGLGQRPGGVDPVLEVLGHAGELARVHRLSRLQQARLFFAHRGRPDVLGGAGHDGDMLVAQVAVGEGRLGPGQLLQLVRDLHPLRGGGARELAAPAQPLRQREGAIGLVLARPVEAAHAIGEHGLEWVDTRFPDLDQPFAQRLALGLANPGRHRLDAGTHLLHGGLEAAISGACVELHRGHAVSLHQGCDRCLS